MYQEVREVYFTSGVIKVMKIESRNKWKKKKKKTNSVKLNTSIYWDLMKDSWHKLNTSKCTIGRRKDGFPQPKLRAPLTP